jgi:hypothetical protein
MRILLVFATAALIIAVAFPVALILFAGLLTTAAILAIAGWFRLFLSRGGMPQIWPNQRPSDRGPVVIDADYTVVEERATRRAVDSKPPRRAP